MLIFDHSKFSKLKKLFLLIFYDTNQFLMIEADKLINKALYLGFKLLIPRRRPYFKIDRHHPIRHFDFLINLMHSFINDI